MIYFFSSIGLTTFGALTLQKDFLALLFFSQQSFWALRKRKMKAYEAFNLHHYCIYF